MTKEMYEDLLERNKLQISELNTLTEEQDRHIVELEVQIEKMKSDVLSLIKDRMNDDIDQNIIERLAEKWEIKEND